MGGSRRLSSRSKPLAKSPVRHRVEAMNGLSPTEIEALFRLMLHEMGPTGWWPADTIFEIMVGAVLVQNTSFANVELSLARLKEAEAFSPDAVAAMDDADLQDLIRWYRQRFDCEPANALDVPDDELRRELPGLFGIGGETADVLMLYVFSRRAFIADTYARRLFSFLGCQLPAGYPAFHRAVAPAVLATGLSTAQLQEFHGLIDEFGKAYRDNEAKAESFIARRQQSDRPSQLTPRTKGPSVGPSLPEANAR